MDRQGAVTLASLAYGLAIVGAACLCLLVSYYGAERVARLVPEPYDALVAIIAMVMLLMATGELAMFILF